MGNGRAGETYRADEPRAKNALGLYGIPLAFQTVMPPRKTLLIVVLVVGLGATMVVSMFSALVALVPLAIAAVPALVLIGRARRLRQMSEGRDLDDQHLPIEGNDYWRREAAKRRIVDTRV